jgi:hypothetical protein
VNSKEENSYDFSPNYVQEFGLRMGGTAVGECNNRKMLQKKKIAIIPSVPNILYRIANEWPPRVFYYLRLFFFASYTLHICFATVCKMTNKKFCLTLQIHPSVRASDCQCRNSSGFGPGILRHSGI